MLSLLASTLGRFRLIGFAEGISYLILLFIAMPLKYGFGMPTAVKTFGAIHGGLFVLYVLYLLISKFEYDWTFKKVGTLFLASLIPFGNFYADKHYLKPDNQ
jgi:integral membrane protein